MQIHDTPGASAAEIKAVIFDIGGVLSNSVDPFIYDEAAKVFNAERDDVVNVIHKFEPDLQVGRITEREFWVGVSAELGVDPVPEQAWDLWGGVHARMSKPNEDTMELAKRLRSAGYKTGILSNTEKSHVEHNRKVGLFDGFDPVVLSCEVGLRKPCREIFQLTLDRLGLPASQVAYTDDNENKLSGARELGMHTHVFTGAAGLEEWLKGLGMDF